MTWILLALLVYALFGAFLVARTMRGMQVSAGVDEWIVLILLWPLMVRLFVQLAMLQTRTRQLEDWADGGDCKR